VPWIADGPLAEDPKEVVTFYAAVVEELALETPLHWSMAEDIAGLAWRQSTRRTPGRGRAHPLHGN
jgi:hypothetical protein